MSTAKTDLIVVGSGYWGKCIAQIYTQHTGKNAVLFDNSHPFAASRNSAGIVNPAWYYKGRLAQTILPAWWNDTILQKSIRWLEEFGGLRKTGEDIEVSYGQYKERMKENKTCWMMTDVIGFLTRAEPNVLSVPAHVTRIRRIGLAWEVESGHGLWYAPQVVIAAGAATDEILERSGIKPVGVLTLAGSALFYTAEDFTLKRPFKVLHSPYLHTVMRPWNGFIRVGDTVDYSPKTADPTMRLQNCFTNYSKSNALVYRVQGHRPMMPESAFVERIDTGLIVATGGHRIGLGMSPAVGWRVVNLLEGR